MTDTYTYRHPTDTTVIALREGAINGTPMKRGDKFFVPADCPVTVSACFIVIKFTAVEHCFSKVLVCINCTTRRYRLIAFECYAIG